MSATRRLLARLGAGALVAGACLVAPQASAAACGSSGITAVVDAQDGAGGGVDARCDPVTGSRTAAGVFSDTGVTVQRNPDGSVCKVDGLPADAQCGRLGTEYWALWWSDGKSGTWVYSQQGDTSLTVPANGSVAWAWQGSSGRRTPAFPPPVHQASPKPSPRSTPTPTRTRTPRATQSSATELAEVTASSARVPVHDSKRAGAGAGTAPHRRPSVSPRKKAAGGTPSPGASGAATTPDAAARAATAPTASDRGSERTGLPVWAPALLLVLLTTGAAGTVWWRKKG